MAKEHRPTRAALKARARTLVERMSARERWIYALPSEQAEAHAPPLLEEAGLVRAPSATIWETPDRTARVALSLPEGLDVTLVEATGAAAGEALAALLAKTGFYAQSTLLETAFDVDDAESEEALGTLAHMAVSWDGDWSALFRVHLEASIAERRAHAARALCIAAGVAGSAAPPLALLAAQAERETDDGVRQALAEARAALATLVQVGAGAAT